MPNKKIKKRFENVFLYEEKNQAQKSVRFFSKIQEEGKDLLDEAINSELAYIVVERLNELWDSIIELKEENKNLSWELLKKSKMRKKES